MYGQNLIKTNWEEKFDHEWKVYSYFRQKEWFKLYSTDNLDFDRKALNDYLKDHYFRFCEMFWELYHDENTMRVSGG